MKAKLINLKRLINFQSTVGIKSPNSNKNFWVIKLDFPDDSFEINLTVTLIASLIQGKDPFLFVVTYYFKNIFYVNFQFIFKWFS